MPRYEAALNSEVGWSDGSFEPLQQVVIEFEGRRFVWHSGFQSGEECLPVITVMYEDPNDHAEESLLVNRLVSALCYLRNLPISIAFVGGSGFKSEMDPPLLAQPAVGTSRILSRPPSEVIVVDDDRLKLVLGLFREGRSANSPFYGFLATYNALDAAFDNSEEERDAFIRMGLADQPAPKGHGNDSFDWADYLRDVLRNAVAHAVRPPGKPVLDPDDLADREALENASSLLRSLVRRRVDEHWGSAVVAR